MQSVGKPFLIAILSLFSLCGPIQARTLFSAAAYPLIEKGAFIMARPNQPPLEYNSTSLLIPASILKIATAAAAFSLLGPDFRFRTEFFQNSRGELIIKGFGDPFLISEEIALISGRLQKKLKVPPARILIDQSAFFLKHKAGGTSDSLNPYDAGNAALAVNFNTINIRVDEGRKAISAEPQTPTLPIMQTFADELEAGEHRINVSGRKGSSSVYSGELFAAFLRQAAPETGLPAFGQLDPFKDDLPPIHTHYSSKPLSKVVEAMLLYSNNFIANQLFLACGAEKYGYPGTWSKGRRTMELFLREEIGLEAGSFRIREGSGLSRENRITAEAMLQILKFFRPHARLLPHCRGHLLKTGTMTGVFNYAGYLRGDNILLPLVILLNQEKNNRDKLLSWILHSQVDRHGLHPRVNGTTKSASPQFPQ